MENADLIIFCDDVTEFLEGITETTFMEWHEFVVLNTFTVSAIVQGRKSNNEGLVAQFWS